MDLVRRAVKDFDERGDGLFGALRGRPVPDAVFWAASEGADYSRAWHAVNLAIAVTSPERRRHCVRLAVSLGVESALVNGVLKNVFPRERPELLGDETYEVRRPRTRSFPSGHASSACLTAVLLGDTLPRLRPLWWSLAAVVSASRVHNRMHHPSDVVAGAAIGTLMGRLVKRVAPLPLG